MEGSSSSNHHCCVLLCTSVYCCVLLCVKGVINSVFETPADALQCWLLVIAWSTQHTAQHMMQHTAYNTAHTHATASHLQGSICCCKDDQLAVSGRQQRTVRSAAARKLTHCAAHAAIGQQR